jgi:hypothetical protein
MWGQGKRVDLFLIDKIKLELLMKIKIISLKNSEDPPTNLAMALVPVF